MMRAAAFALAVAASPAALACGVCIDDKVAATYDHRVVTAALERRQVVVYAEVKGDTEAGERTRAALAAARGVRGVDAGTLRASREPATISFALDEGVARPEAALATAQRRLAGTRLELLRVVR